jgi:alkylhydroperoxidase family enzyme
MNGCAFCLDMQSREARAQGETEQRLHLLNGWREAPLYTDHERAALQQTASRLRLVDGASSSSW